MEAEQYVYQETQPTLDKIWTVIQLILAAILDFGILGMCYDNMIVRNEFAMLKFVENDILIILIAQK